jgi:hypothetical protein
MGSRLFYGWQRGVCEVSGGSVYPLSRSDGLARMPRTQDPNRAERHSQEPRFVAVRYAALTVALFLPLIFTFIRIRDLYPFAASRMMLGTSDSQRGQNYFILRGETVTGETFDLPAITLTNALTGRSWSLVRTAVENTSFKIRYPHPTNVQLLLNYGGIDQLPAAARLEELLRSWGTIYNSRLPESSNQRLRSIRLDSYRWEGETTSESNRLVQSWTVAL